MKILFPTAVLFVASLSVVQAQEFRVAQSKVFTPQNKKILLLKDAASPRQIILFQTNLRVNTDGSPLSCFEHAGNIFAVFFNGGEDVLPRYAEAGWDRLEARIAKLFEDLDRFAKFAEAKVLVRV